jgi:hypothetical protein
VILGFEVRGLMQVLCHLNHCASPQILDFQIGPAQQVNIPKSPKLQNLNCFYFPQTFQIRTTQPVSLPQVLVLFVNVGEDINLCLCYNIRIFYF